jgi:hypothetical protein
MQYLGDVPMHHLANWRIQLGARLWRESNRTVATIEIEVGYDSEAAFLRAFRRLVGMPPAAWRRARECRQCMNEQQHLQSSCVAGQAVFEGAAVTARLEIAERPFDLQAFRIKPGHAGGREMIERDRYGQQPRFLAARGHLLGMTATGSPPLTGVLMPAVAAAPQEHQPAVDSVALGELRPPQRTGARGRLRKELDAAEPACGSGPAQFCRAPHPSHPVPAERLDGPEPRHPEPRGGDENRADPWRQPG